MIPERYAPQVYALFRIVTGEDQVDVELGVALPDSLSGGATGEREGTLSVDAGDTPGDAMFPGNTLPLEFDPKPQHRSAGLATPDLGRRKSDLITVRGVTVQAMPMRGAMSFLSGL